MAGAASHHHLGASLHGLGSRESRITVRPRIGTQKSAKSLVVSFQRRVQAVLGLQNDIVGWEKDRQTNNQLNSVQVLIRDGIPAEVALAQVIQWHNQLVTGLVMEVAFRAVGPHGGLDVRDGMQHDNWVLYCRIVVGFVNAMAEWMLSSKRYHT